MPSDELAMHLAVDKDFSTEGQNKQRLDLSALSLFPSHLWTRTFFYKNLKMGCFENTSQYANLNLDLCLQYLIPISNITNNLSINLFF